jgi:molybdopterin converting factor small subunit
MAALHFTQNLRRHTVCPDCTLAAATVAELLQRYFADYPTVRGYVLDDQGGVRKHIKILVDGRNLSDRAKLTDALEETSEVYVFQALSGG